MTVREIIDQLEAKVSQVRALLREIEHMTGEADWGQSEIAKEALRILEK